MPHPPRRPASESQRGLVRSARALAAAACISLVGGLAHPVTAVADTTPPSVTAAFYSAGLITSKIDFDFDENLPSVYRLPDALKSAFSVSVDGTAREIENIFGGSGRDLWLKRRVFTGQTIVVSYDQSVAGTDAIADADGNKLASFTTGSGGVPAVLNNSNLAAPGSNTAAITNLSLRNEVRFGFGGVSDTVLRARHHVLRGVDGASPHLAHLGSFKLDGHLGHHGVLGRRRHAGLPLWAFRHVF